MKFLISLSLILFLYFSYGFYISQYAVKKVPSTLKKELASNYYDYKGSLNVHTNLGRGASAPLDIINEAKKAELDFLFFTDTYSSPLASIGNHPKQLDESTSFASGYYGNILVLYKHEVSFLDSRLLFVEKEDTYDFYPPNSLYLTDLLSQKKNQTKSTLLVLSQPFINGPTWSGEYPPGLDGIEVLNPRSISNKTWNNSKLSVLWSLLFYPFNSEYAFLRLFSEPTDEIALWDQLLKQNKSFGFAGTDVTAKSIPFPGVVIKFPSYQKSFEIVSNHILLESELTGQFVKDTEKIMKALKKGQFYIAIDLLGDPYGFYYVIENDENFAMMGDLIKFKKGQKIKLHLPKPPKDFYEIVIYRDGQIEHLVNTQDLTYELKGPGIYRASVRISPFFPLPDGKKWITWIYTNPIFVE